MPGKRGATFASQVLSGILTLKGLVNTPGTTVADNDRAANFNCANDLRAASNPCVDAAEGRTFERGDCYDAA